MSRSGSTRGTGPQRMFKSFPSTAMENEHMVLNVAEQADRVIGTFSNLGTFLIGGEWVTAQSGATLTTSDPGTGNVLAEVPLGGTEDIDMAVRSAREALASWRRTVPLERAKILWRI